MMNRALALIDGQMMILKRTREELVWLEQEKNRTDEDCHTVHADFNGFALLFSPHPHVERYGEDCVICLDTFDENDELLLTNCGHLFHNHCFETNKIFNGSICPKCK
jgi:phenylalanyl-tRNA synthetase alpha subunit